MNREKFREFREDEFLKEEVQAYVALYKDSINKMKIFKASIKYKKEN